MYISIGTLVVVYSFQFQRLKFTAHTSLLKSIGEVSEIFVYGKLSPLLPKAKHLLQKIEVGIRAIRKANLKRNIDRKKLFNSILVNLDNGIISGGID